MARIVTFATLGEKTTVMPPEILLKAGVPCCRLVQNPGEFVVTFPRAYHSGFSHGFNCAEAANIATSGWLIVAREAAVRRASIGYAPMMSHSQLLYDLALSLSLSEEASRHEPRSCRLKDRLKAEGDGVVKRNFMEDVMKNNELFEALGNGSPITILSKNVLKSLCIQNEESFNSGGGVLDRRQRRRKYSAYCEPDNNADPSTIFSCISCATPCYAGAAIVMPTEAAAQYLTVTDPNSFSGKLPLISSPTSEQKEISGLGLLALAYGESSDSEEDSDHATDQVVPKSCNSGHLSTGYGPMISAHVEDSWRMHVFCLQHANEIKKHFQFVGGVHILLVCHPDYPTIVSAAKEFGAFEDTWTDLGYLDINEQDKAMIKSALDDDDVTNVHKDWIVRLGLDIFYSARLSGSSFYTKQMPYNSVIYKVFGRCDPSNDPMTPKQSGKQKKIVVAGRWCGKVWMSNQVHPLLVAPVADEGEDEAGVFVSSDMNVKVERKMSKRKRTPKVELPLTMQPADLPLTGVIRRKPRTSLDKKKTIKVKKVADKKAGQAVMDSGDESEDGPTRFSRRRITDTPSGESWAKTKSKQKAKKATIDEVSEEDGEFCCNIEGCNMSFKSKKELKKHEQNKCRVAGCKKIFSSHRYLAQHQRVHMDDRPLKCPWNGCQKTFKWAWALTEHKRVHTGVRPYVCSEDGCGKTFRFVSDFSRHKRKTGHCKKQVVDE